MIDGCGHYILDKCNLLISTKCMRWCEGLDVSKGVTKGQGQNSELVSYWCEINNNVYTFIWR